MPFTLASVRIPNGEQPICGVMLEPYILFRDESSNVVTALSVPNEGATVPYDEPEPPVVLRSRWYRYISHLSLGKKSEMAALLL